MSERKYFEFVGITDLVVQLKTLLEEGFVVDFDSVAGIGSSFQTYYFDAVDTEGAVESYSMTGRTEFVKSLVSIYASGAVVDQHTLGANGGRYNYIWFYGTLPEEEEEETPPPPPETVVEASPAAIKLAVERGIDISLVQGSGAAGKVTKPDVTKYLESLPKE